MPARRPKRELPSKSSLFFRDRVKEIRSVEPKAAKNHADELSWAKRSGWIETRGFLDISNSLERKVGIQLVGEIEKIARLRGQVNMLEDGPGKGLFLDQLLTRMKLKHIPYSVDIISLDPFHSVEHSIHRKHIGLAEEFVPDRQYDLIFSNAASINYAHYKWQREHLLSFAHSLRKNGLMVVGFYLSKTKSPAAVNFTLLKNTPDREIQRRAKYKDWEGPWNHEMNGIARSFQKQGFNAQFYFDTYLEMHFLVVRRIR